MAWRLGGAIVAGIIALPALAAARPPDAESSGEARRTTQTDLPKGVIVPKVAWQSDPSQSYALYLPSNYTASKRWPVLLAFDPGARGIEPVELAREAAEERGWIVAGSNNSHNGAAVDEMRAAQGMWSDVRTRFSVDEQQTYATGFSGGARAAFGFADQCRCVQGVIAAGAGLPTVAGTLRSLPFVVFMTLAEEDFNYPELVALEKTLDDIHVANRLRRFEGRHQWPPAPVMGEAVAWMDVQAMRLGRRPQDEAFLAQQRAAAMRRAQADATSGDVLSAYEEYRKGAADFSGQPGAEEFARRAAALRASPDLQRAEKQEREDTARQRRLADEINSQLVSLPSLSGEIDQRRMEIIPRVEGLREDLRHSKKPRDTRVLRRVVNDIFATAVETGATRRRQGKLMEAQTLFEIAATAMPEEPWPPFGLARVYAATGQKKQALKALDRAVANGLKDASLLQEIPEFASLRQEPHFQELITKLSAGERP